MKVDESGIFTINLGWKKLKAIKVKSGKKKMSYTVKKLKSGIKYKFKVVAYRKYKGKTYTAAKTKSVTTKKESANNKNIGNKNDTKKPTDNNTKNPADDVGYQKKMLDKVNEYRRAAGVPELKLNQDLCNIALRRMKTYFWDDCDERGERAIHRYHTNTGRYPEGMANWCPVCAMGN